MASKVMVSSIMYLFKCVHISVLCYHVFWWACFLVRTLIRYFNRTNLIDFFFFLNRNSLTMSYSQGLLLLMWKLLQNTLNLVIRIGSLLCIFIDLLLYCFFPRSSMIQVLASIGLSKEQTTIKNTLLDDDQMNTFFFFLVLSHNSHSYKYLSRIFFFLYSLGFPRTSSFEEDLQPP